MPTLSSKRAAPSVRVSPLMCCSNIANAAWMRRASRM
jgi:hypothetical protein